MSASAGEPEPDERLERILSEVRSRRYRDLAKDTQFTDAWVIVGLILTLVGLAAGNSFLLAAAVAMFAVAVAAWAWNQLTLYGLHYRRNLSETRAFLGETVTLTLETRNLKLLPVTWVHVIDIFPSSLPMDGQQVVLNHATNFGEFTTFWSLGAFGRLRRRFTVQCSQRGYHTYGPATVTSGDAFGMFSRRGTLPEKDRLIIYPRLYSAAELGLPAKNPFGERAAEALVEDPPRTAGIRLATFRRMKRVTGKPLPLPADARAASTSPARSRRCWSSSTSRLSRVTGWVRSQS
jgi:hypothetical protein